MITNLKTLNKHQTSRNVNELLKKIELLYPLKAWKAFWATHTRSIKCIGTVHNLLDLTIPS